jgi:endonuclease G
MAMDNGLPAARFARTLFANAAPGEGHMVESVGLGRTEEIAEAVRPSVEELVPKSVPEGFSRDEVTAVAHKLLASDELSPRESFVTEAIIIPDLRPAVFVTGDDYAIDHPAWPDYVTGTPAHAHFRKAIPSIGRIELIGNPGVPYGGTGFVVARDLVMTNRHVASLFAAGLGIHDLRFQDQMGSAIDFGREHGTAPKGTPFAVREVAMIHPYWDLALLRVEGLEDRPPLTFAAYDPDLGNPRRIAVIGYPAFDPRNDAAVQEQVFHGVYNVKRLQPGLFNGRRKIDSYGKLVDAGTHDSSTLGGNSGSVVIEADGGKVVGLHFAGIYKDSNFAVPASDLARDPRMIEAGLRFEPAADTRGGPWDPFWAAASSAGNERGAPGGGAAPQGGQTMAGDEGKTIKVKVPVEIELSIGLAGASLAGATAMVGGGDLTEKMVEPFHDSIELPRDGYAPDFLGIPVPMPEPRRPEECARLADGSHELKYHNFSVVMNAGRRLALFAASNVDARAQAKEPEPGHKYTRAGLTGLGEGDVEKWYTDPRIRGIEQLPDRFFNKDRKAFDKGHIVRREDVAWGNSFAEVRRANGDTYFVTNCSPQTAGFNRSNRKDNWGALEDLVLRQAQAEKYCLFAGPVLEDGDPEFTGVDDLGGIKVRIPQKYWKVVVARAGDELKAFAFVLKQDLSQTAMEFAVPETWQRHMVRLSELQAELGSLDFAPELLAADQFDAVGAGGEAALDATMEAIRAMTPAEAATEGPPRDHGRFVGLPLQVVFNTDQDDRRWAKLLEPLTYVQPDGGEWPAPKDAWLDGASIPRPFWSVIGGPFEGLYLEASVVHDYYCDHHLRPWRDVHRMFYDAMLCRGVSGFKARIMYYAVYRFGPRWDIVEGVESAAAPGEALTDAKAPSILADAQALAQQDLSPEAIEALADRSAAQAGP